jgi:hypothetical protein
MEKIQPKVQNEVLKNKLIYNIPFVFSNNDCTECYINSSLQCILCVPEVFNYLLRINNHINQIENIEKCGQGKKSNQLKENYSILKVAKHLSILLSKLEIFINKKNESQIKEILSSEKIITLNPENLKKYIKLTFGDNTSYFIGQQCAFEFIKKLLIKLNIFFKKYFNENIIQNTFGSEKRCLSTCNRCSSLNGITEFSEIQCLYLNPKQKEKNNNSNIYNLNTTSSLKTNNNNESVASLIIKYFKPEEVTDWKCHVCGNIGCTKSWYFSTFPEYLFICLKRFNNQMKKNNNPVFINLTIEILKCNYELVCDIVHIGKSINSGHYISIIKKFNNFFLMNDNNGKFIGNIDNDKFNEIDYVLNNSYVLLYRKRDDKNN